MGIMDVSECLVVSGYVLILVASSGADGRLMGPGMSQGRDLAQWLEEFKETIGGDPLFQRIVSQIWKVHRNLKDKSTIYGTQIDPINMDEQMGPLDVPIQREELLPTTARIEGIEIHGLSTVALDDSHMKRKELLNDLDMKVTFKFDKIFINGTYRVETNGIWWIPGNHFSMHLTRCHISYLAHLALVDFFNNNGTETGSGQNRDGLSYKWPGFKGSAGSKWNASKGPGYKGPGSKGPSSKGPGSKWSKGPGSKWSKGPGSKWSKGPSSKGPFFKGPWPESQKKSKCTKEDVPDVQIKNLALPMDCFALDFNFFGATDWLVEFLGLYVVQQIIEFATNVAREQVNHLLCSAN